MATPICQRRIATGKVDAAFCRLPLSHDGLVQGAERYYSNPGVKYIEIDLPPAATALVRRRADRRRVMMNLEECSRDIAAGTPNMPKSDPKHDGRPGHQLGVK
jgi:hypothetical protein